MGLVSIIVPVLNEADFIEQTLAAVAAVHGDKEITVVDGGSEDSTVERTRACGVRVMSAPRGRGSQLHAGALASRGDVLWFLHADALPSPGALDAIQAALLDPRVAGGNFRLRFEGRSRTALQLNLLYPWLRLFGLVYGDAGLFVRRSVYEQVGGFRAFALFEDVDLVRRIRRHGRIVRLSCRITTSSRRFERRHWASMWAQWIVLQILYWAGVHPNRLARWYGNVRA